MGKGKHGLKGHVYRENFRKDAQVTQKEVPMGCGDMGVSSIRKKLLLLHIVYPFALFKSLLFIMFVILSNKRMNYSSKDF